MLGPLGSCLCWNFRAKKVAVLTKFVFDGQGQYGPEQNYHRSFDSTGIFASGKGQERPPFKQTSAKMSHPFSILLGEQIVPNQNCHICFSCGHRQMDLNNTTRFFSLDVRGKGWRQNRPQQNCHVHLTQASNNKMRLQGTICLYNPIPIQNAKHIHFKKAISFVARSA